MSNVDNDKFLKQAKQAVCVITSWNPDDLYIVWFAKVLGNWKALISTDVVPGLYWEVTYDGGMNRAYVDSYEKLRNVVVHDQDLRIDS